ncbi:thiamine-monophosphate kinase [Oceanicaulis sp. HTCC2633]|uniref:thiamine-phosphate kinase n=1 Tax=Oceanicaulis sp. HTCC2633 TaxID=314254 RepID=UPI000066D671|nr:thiamine-phosphate kinase [Oceanicaulis sp. HTCC2633]EAP90905.1 thiamine-monophosphate kinase [Oceanicaulis sp. HTCC2633]
MTPDLMSGQGEFEYIRSRLAPLSVGLPGAANLTDDGAVLSPPEGCEWAITADTLVEGRHFPLREDPALAARKALRVNLSDLAAMGADPHAYLACVVWPETGREARMTGFADGLALDQAEFGVHLAGGDTTSADGPWMISITAFGAVPTGQAVRRAGAKPGDVAILTGTIGDAGLGLLVRQGEYAPNQDDAAYLDQRFTLPEPRCALSSLVRSFAHSAIDISDGLLSDARHIAHAAGVSLTLDLDKMPRSEAAEAWLSRQADRDEALMTLASMGDDYELLVTIPQDRAQAFIEAVQVLGVQASRLGEVCVSPSSTGQLVVTAENRVLSPSSFGFTHF